MPVDYKTNPAVFDKPIIILEQRIIRDSYNNARAVWHPFARVLASIEPLLGREYWIASMSQSEGSVRIVMRYRRGITAQMRFKYNSLDGIKIYEIKSPPINILMQNQYLEVMCRELIEAKGGDYD